MSSHLFDAINPRRLLDTARRLVAEYSPTGQARPALDCLANILEQDGFCVERPEGGHSAAPAVVVRFDSGKPGPTLQFNGHLDTVHLPFVPPRIEGTLLRGSGSSDMKAGTAAAVEALRALRDSGSLPAGQILLTAHDLHESPWGDGSQLDRLIGAGHVGDAVLLPEYLNECLPIVGRGGLTWKVTLRRPGKPIHEVLRPDEPSVITAGADLVREMVQLNEEVRHKRDVHAGPESVFIGQIHAGEIFNQFPQECMVEGTRRWLPGTLRVDVEKQLHALIDKLAKTHGLEAIRQFTLMRDAFRLDETHPFVAAFQQSYASLSGQHLPVGAKPFCDDGNSFWHLAKVPAITHGPRAGGAHTLDEWVDIDDLVRVAKLYAQTAVTFCTA